MKEELRRFLSDESGGVVDEILSIAILVVIGGAVLRSIADTVNDAIYAVIDFIQRITPAPLP